MSLLRDTEYDPWTGEIKKWYLEDDGSVTCVRELDEKALVDACKAEANQRTHVSRKEKFHKAFSIPPLIALEIMRNHHLDLMNLDADGKKKLEKIVELEYPYLKTTSIKLWRPV